VPAEGELESDAASVLVSGRPNHVNHKRVERPEERAPQASYGGAYKSHLPEDPVVAVPKHHSDPLGRAALAGFYPGSAGVACSG
jgi:hypothetical protein